KQHSGGLPTDSNSNKLAWPHALCDSRRREGYDVIVTRTPNSEYLAADLQRLSRCGSCGPAASAH
ncbi:MAG: hypothetical protein WBO42_06460, partial [Candidatus Nanopelagicales bacterium]